VTNRGIGGTEEDGGVIGVGFPPPQDIALRCQEGSGGGLAKVWDWDCRRVLLLYHRSIGWNDLSLSYGLSVGVLVDVSERERERGVLLPVLVLYLPTCLPDSIYSSSKSSMSCICYLYVYSSALSLSLINSSTPLPLLVFHAPANLPVLLAATALLILLLLFRSGGALNDDRASPLAQLIRSPLRSCQARCQDSETSWRVTT
jgi:hypothetical protein